MYSQIQDTAERTFGLSKAGSAFMFVFANFRPGLGGVVAWVIVSFGDMDGRAQMLATDDWIRMRFEPTSFFLALSTKNNISASDRQASGPTAGTRQERVFGQLYCFPQQEDSRAVL